MIPDISAVTGLISAVKTMKDLSSSLEQMKTDDAVRNKAAELNFAIIDLQNFAMAVQAQNQELLSTNSALAKQVEEMARWDEEIGRYELTTLADGVYVYKCRAADRPDELEIPLCVNCFGNRKRSVLQRGVKTIHGTAYDCPNCKTEITDHSDRSALQSSFRM